MFGHEEHDWMSPYEVAGNRARSTLTKRGDGHIHPLRSGFEPATAAEVLKRQRLHAIRPPRHMMPEDSYAEAGPNDVAAALGRHLRAMHGVSDTVYKKATVYDPAATVYKKAYPQKAIKAIKAIRPEKAIKAIDVPTAADPRYLEESGLWPHMRALLRTPGHLSAVAGFGDASVPYTTKSGKTGTASATTQMSCGDAFGVQQMLTDLGYPVDVDGIIGPQTMGALTAWSQASGAPYTPNTLPQGDTCAALETAWTQAHGGGAPSPGAPDYVPPGPQSVPATQTPGIMGSISAWWGNQTTTTKYLVAGGGAVAAAVLVAALVKTPKTAHAHANRRL